MPVSGLPKAAAQTNTVSALNFNGKCNDPTTLTTDNCSIVAYLVLFTRVLSGLVGIIVIAMIVIGGIQYSTARNDPQAIAAARGRIINALIALLFYIFIFAILQWLVPGGVF